MTCEICAINDTVTVAVETCPVCGYNVCGDCRFNDDPQMGIRIVNGPYFLDHDRIDMAVLKPARSK